MLPVVVSSILCQLHPGEIGREVVELFAAWRRVLPRRVVDNAWPVRIVDRTLIVHVKNAMWCSELDFLRLEMLATLKRAVPQLQLNGLLLRVDANTSPPVMRSGAATALDMLAPRPISAMSPDLARALTRVGDENLRQAILQAAGVSVAVAAQPSES